MHKPDHFTSGDHLWEPGVHWQTWRWQGIPIGLKIEDEGTKQNPKIKISIYTPLTYLHELENRNVRESRVDSLVAEISYLYNVHLDLKDFYDTYGKDQLLQPVIKRMRGMRPGQPSPLYEYLIVGIVLQNASVRRSIQMFKMLLEHFRTLVEFNHKNLWCFWNPGDMRTTSEWTLRKLKLGYRAKSIKKLDNYFAKGLVDEYALRMQPIETQRKELLKIYGVGPATVWYILFDVFHQWGVFDHISPWEQKIYSKLLFGRDTEHPVSAKTIVRFFKRYGTYRRLAEHYFWEDLWWRHANKPIAWLQKEIRT